MIIAFREPSNAESNRNPRARRSCMMDKLDLLRITYLLTGVTYDKVFL